jgi:hypothetical protein
MRRLSHKLSLMEIQWDCLAEIVVADRAETARCFGKQKLGGILCDVRKLPWRTNADCDSKTEDQLREWRQIGQDGCSQTQHATQSGWKRWPQGRMLKVEGFTKSQRQMEQVVWSESPQNLIALTASARVSGSSGSGETEESSASSEKT